MAKRKPKTKQTASVNYYDIDANNGDCRDTKEFKEFERGIESVLKPFPQTIREIRLAAKTDNYYWLSMALDNLVVKGKAKLIRGLIDKYELDSREIAPMPKIDRAKYHTNFLCK